MKSAFFGLIITTCIGLLSGLASAFFLISLEWVTQLRTAHPNLIVLLPLGGLVIGLCYHHWGFVATKGNNLLLEEYKIPQKGLPLVMAPLVFFSTLMTHLCGGSAGREGTAVQMGAVLAYRFSKIKSKMGLDNKILVLLGVSAGFSSVFGTPLAGALFAIELFFFDKITIKSAFLAFLAAYVSHFTVLFLGVKHNQYFIDFFPPLEMVSIVYTFAVAVLFGLAALLFSKTIRFWNRFFLKTILHPPLRPLFGGLALLLIAYFFNIEKSMGLGIPVIVQSFFTASSPSDWILKIVLTGFTLGAGFKGGEVTPLFFVGATLGSALSVVVPLPIALLAGMGFVATFAGATHTPVASTVLGMELFGAQAGIFCFVACVVAYFCSGKMGIYHSQTLGGPKVWLYKKITIAANKKG